MANDLDPASTIRLILGQELRDARMAAGMALSDLGKFKLGAGSTISRIETGKVPVLPFRVVGLCKVYGVDRAKTDELEALAYRASEETIFDEYSDVIPRWFSVFVRLESSARRILAWDGGIVTGLLQTPAYSRAVFESYLPAMDERTIERLLKIRHERQMAVFTRADARVCIVLGAGVLAQEVGGAVVAAEQRSHLRTLCARGGVDVRVLPFSAGAHAAMTGPFTVLEVPGLRDVVYAESAYGANYIDKVSKIPQFRETFVSIYDRSIPLEEYTP